MLFLVLIVGLLIVGAIAGSSNRSRIYDEGRRLHSAFVELGSMKGKPFSELKQAVGCLHRSTITQTERACDNGRPQASIWRFCSTKKTAWFASPTNTQNSRGEHAVYLRVRG